MRVNTMKKLLEKIENVEKETNSEATIEGYLEGFIINLYKHGQPLARSIFNEKWAGDDCMNEFERFEATAFHNARKYEEQRELEKEKEFVEYLNSLVCSYSNEKLEMFYKIKDIGGVRTAKILWILRNSNGVDQITEGIPLTMPLKEFKCKIRNLCEEAERIKEGK